MLGNATLFRLHHKFDAWASSWLAAQPITGDYLHGSVLTTLSSNTLYIYSGCGLVWLELCIPYWYTCAFYRALFWYRCKNRDGTSNGILWTVWAQIIRKSRSDADWVFCTAKNKRPCCDCSVCQRLEGISAVRIRIKMIINTNQRNRLNWSWSGPTLWSTGSSLSRGRYDGWCNPIADCMRCRQNLHKLPDHDQRCWNVVGEKRKNIGALMLLVIGS